MDSNAVAPVFPVTVYVINVPRWFKAIWNVVKAWVDEDTLQKVYILRGKEEIGKAMRERIPEENIPEEYGGTSVPLGQAPEELALFDLMEHNNDYDEWVKGKDYDKWAEFQLARVY